MDWTQYHAFRTYKRCWNNLRYNNPWYKLSARNSNETSRNNRSNRYKSNNRYSIYYYFLVGLLSIGVPVRAEVGEGNTVLNPQTSAAATGNVTNQAVQFQNNSGVSRQQYGGGVGCNGPVMSLSPYYL